MEHPPQRRLGGDDRSRSAVFAQSLPPPDHQPGCRFHHHAAANSTTIMMEAANLIRVPKSRPIHAAMPTCVERCKLPPADSSPTRAQIKGPEISPGIPKNSPTSVPMTAPETARALAPTRLAPNAAAVRSKTNPTAAMLPIAISQPEPTC